MQKRTLYRVVMILCLGCMVGLSCGCTWRWGKKGPKGDPDDDVGLRELDDTYEQVGDHDDGDLAVVYGLQLDSVHFGYDSFQIDASEIPKLEAVAEHLRRNPGHRLISEGHCDERGSREYNVSLGENRALSVRADLIRFGIEDHRIQTRSMGEEQPLELGHNEGAWRLNRRVEFIIHE